MGVADLGDAAALDPAGGAVFRADQTAVGHEGRRGEEAPEFLCFHDERQGAQRVDSLERA